MTWYLLYSVYSVLTVTVVILVLWFYCKLKFDYWRRLNIKYLPPVPIFGNVTKSMLLLKSFQETYQEFYEAMGSDFYIGYYEMNIPMLMVKDPQLVSAILVKDFRHFQNRGQTSVFTENRKLNPLSHQIVTARGEHWKFLRQGISPIFTSGKIKQMHEKLCGTFDITYSYLDKQLNRQNSADVNVQDLFERLTGHVIISSIFGTENISITTCDEFQQMMDETIKPKLSKTWHKILAAYCPTWLNNILNRAEVSDKVIGYFKSLVLDTMKHRRMHGIQGKDMLQTLMDLQNSHTDPVFADKDGSRMLLPSEKIDELDIVANSFTLMSGGFGTISSTLSFCAYELALNEDIQHNLRLEVQRVKDDYGHLNYDSLKKLSLLEAVIAETLRKYPITFTAGRECSQDYVIPGTEICLPKGTKIKIPTWSIHRDWKYYSDPEKFDPERFLGNNKHSIQNGTYLPFGDGPRSCVGKRFAEVEMKAAVADMILKYDFKPCAKTEIPIKFKKGSNILQPENGIWVNMTRRETLEI